jgi:hypothetical protein
MTKNSTLPVIVELMLTVVIGICTCRAIAAEDNKADKVNLQLRLKPGNEFKMHMNVEQQVSAPHIMRTQTVGLDFVCEVQQLNDNGDATVKITFDSITIKQERLPANIAMFSNQNDANLSLDKNSTPLAKRSFSLAMSSLGHITRLPGDVGPLTDIHWLAPIPEGESKAKGNANSQSLNELLGDAVFTSLMEQMLGVFPNKPVAMDETWQERLVVPAFFHNAPFIPPEIDSAPNLTMILKNTWTLKSRKKGLAVLEVKSNVETNPAEKPASGTASWFFDGKTGPRSGTYPITTKYTFLGEQKGTLEVDEISGWPRQGKLDQRFAVQCQRYASAGPSIRNSGPSMSSSSISCQRTLTFSRE